VGIPVARRNLECPRGKPTFQDWFVLAVFLFGASYFLYS